MMRPNLQYLPLHDHGQADTGRPPTPLARWPTVMLAELPAPRDLHRLVRRERLLCRRGRPPFALVLFDVGDPEVDPVVAGHLVQAFRSRSRIGDRIGWFSRTRIGLLLPVTNHAGAHLVGAELCKMLGASVRQPPFEVLSAEVDGAF